MSDELVQLHVDNGVAQVVLNRPEKMNSFTGEMHILLRETLARVEANTAIRALVLTGAGRGFCAGQDLADEAVRFTPGEAPPDLGDVVRTYYAPLVMQLSRMRVPTIAAVNGVAAGAGASLAMACDLVVASETASFVIPFAKIGLIPDTGASWHLPRAVGQARAREAGEPARRERDGRVHHVEQAQSRGARPRRLFLRGDYRRGQRESSRSGLGTVGGRGEGAGEGSEAAVGKGDLLCVLEDGPPFLVGPGDGVDRGRSGSNRRGQAPRLGVGAAKDAGEVVHGVARPRDRIRARIRGSPEPLDEGGLGDVDVQGAGGRGGGVGGCLALGGEVLREGERKRERG